MIIEILREPSEDKYRIHFALEEPIFNQDCGWYSPALTIGELARLSGEIHEAYIKRHQDNDACAKEKE